MELFSERGLEVGVAEIAQCAGVGRGTLFRNFPTKDDLIAAIVVERMTEAAKNGRALLDADDAGEALFEFLGELAGAQRLDRALVDAVADTWLANCDIRAAHAEVVGVLDVLLTRAQAAGAVRGDVGAIDLMFMLKGVCEVASALAHVDDEIVARHLDLIRSAVTASASSQPLRGRSLSLEDIERAFPQAGAAAATRRAG